MKPPRETLLQFALMRSGAFAPAERFVLARRFGGLEALLALEDRVLLENGLGEVHVRALRDLDVRAAADELEGLRERGIGVLNCLDSRFPWRLAQIAACPLLLFYKGDPDLLSRSPVLAVVGSRKMTDYGRRSVEKLIPGLVAAGVVIVSGMAAGVDACAHATTLAHGGTTLAVQAQGVERGYPRTNQLLYENLCARGLVLSEYPVPPSYTGPALFPQRNRLISGLADGVLVVEAARRSGSLVTAYLGLEQNRQIYAVPGDIDRELSEGCLDLIRRGAKPVSRPEDILEDFSSSFGTPRKDAVVAEGGGASGAFFVSELEKSVYDFCRGRSATLDELVEATGKEAPELAALLVGMELDGRLRGLAGGRYQAAS